MNFFSKFVALPLAMFNCAVMAQEVSVDEAKSRALDFLSTQTSGPRYAKDKDLSEDLTLAYTSKSNKKTCFYVFNVGIDNGFVIVGGDEVAIDILGNCDHGNFDYDSAPENFKWWLSQYTDQIANADISDTKNSPRKVKAASYGNAIEPLIKTTWNQYYPYNAIVPSNLECIKVGYEYCYPTGCVATAMAQLMYYYKCPATNGEGSKSYYYTDVVFGDLQAEANFSNTIYDWDNMLLTYTSNGNYSDAEINAISTLLYHAGVSVNMKYSVSGSGAYFEDIKTALINYFKFNGDNIKLQYRFEYKESEWDKMLYNELSNGRPIIYTGSSLSNEGHAFLCVGYRNTDNTFYFNWGWGGDYDGYYGTKALEPDDMNFNGLQMIYVGVQPLDSQRRTIKYTVSPSGWGTLTLPFSADKPESMILYSCEETENDVLQLKEVEGNIKRNTPYIIYDEPDKTYTFEGPNSIVKGKYSFQEGILLGVVGYNTEELVSGQDYILQVTDNKATFNLYNDTGTRYASQFRAILRPKNKTKAPQIILPNQPGETESIETVTTDTNKPAGIYSIDGKCLSDYQKGLNIIILEDRTVKKVYVK